MGKRTIFDSDANGAQLGHDVKRQRIQGSHEPRSNDTPAEEVTNARQLQKALLFDQTASADFRNGKYMNKAASMPHNQKE